MPQTILLSSLQDDITRILLTLLYQTTSVHPLFPFFPTNLHHTIHLLPASHRYATTNPYHLLDDHVQIHPPPLHLRSPYLPVRQPLPQAHHALPPHGRRALLRRACHWPSSQGRHAVPSLLSTWGWRHAGDAGGATGACALCAVSESGDGGGGGCDGGVFGAVMEGEM